MGKTILRKRVDMSTWSSIITMLAMALIVFLCINQFQREENEFWCWLLLGIITVWGFCVLFYGAMYLKLTDDSIEVETSMRIKKFPFANIEEVKVCPANLPIHRLCGSGGFLGYWGWFSTPSIGKYFGYYGMPSEAFMIRLKSGRYYMLGCRDSKEMAKALADQFKSQMQAPLPPKGEEIMPPLGGLGASSPFSSSWDQPLPEDEIHRQQQMKERLKPGLEVELRGLGRFIYNGTWDTMHSFYPAEGQDLPALMAKGSRCILRRDLAGHSFVQLPYTLLADEVIIP